MVEFPVVHSVDRPRGDVSESFILEGELFDTVHFMDSRMASFRIAARPLIRYMGHVLHKCSFTPFSKGVNEIKPFEHCILLRQALNSPGVKGYKLSVQQDRDSTLFRPSQDFHSGSIARRSAEKVLDSIKGDFTKLPLLNKSKEKTKVSFQASGPFAQYLHDPLLEISKMHKEDNIQAIVSTPRPNLVLEEKARDQLKRAVEFHEMFY